jgi:hypothetical protein
MPNGSPILVRGMHGLGDNLHQRAIVRQLLARGDSLFLETPWPCLYHDLVGPRLALVSKGSKLRTQAKNAAREAGRFTRRSAPPGARQLSVSYTPAGVLAAGSVLGAMCRQCGVSLDAADFRLPVPDAWLNKARAWLASWRPARPLLLYRPLVERTEWGGCRARSPDHTAYAGLLASVRARYFVVSLADLEPRKEWTVGHDVKPDVALHRGELDVETIAGLTRLARLVWSSPGFMVILAQAVGTPSVCVFGGYEDGRSFSGGARFTPHLAIQPINPCPCFRHDCPCDKRIALAEACAQLAEFVAAADRRPSAA